jgi:pimeloyl-ACP methyl ester carboxylesterase
MAPSSLAPTAQTLDVPGARLYYEVRGKGPLVVLVGAPMDARSFGPLAELLADDYTVLTTDPRGINRSPVDDPGQDSTPEMRADDLSRLVACVDAGPAVVLGSSGGAVSALALVQGHPEVVRGVIAHEPPLIELLPDAAELNAGNEVVIARWLAGDYAGSWRAFLENANIQLPEGVFEAVFGGVPDAQALADTTYQNTHMLRPTAQWQPDLAALRTAGAGRGGHRRGVGGAGLRPDVPGAGFSAGYRADDVPGRAHGVRRGSLRVRWPAAFGPAG